MNCHIFNFPISRLMPETPLSSSEVTHVAQFITLCSA
jgi:hypothetical protein